MLNKKIALTMMFIACHTTAHAQIDSEQAILSNDLNNQTNLATNLKSTETAQSEATQPVDETDVVIIHQPEVMKAGRMDATDGHPRLLSRPDSVYNTLAYGVDEPAANALAVRNAEATCGKDHAEIVSNVVNTNVKTEQNLYMLDITYRCIH